MGTVKAGRRQESKIVVLGTGQDAAGDRTVLGKIFDALCTGGVYYILYMALLISKLFCREGLNGWGGGGGGVNYRYVMLLLRTSAIIK